MFFRVLASYHTSGRDCLRKNAIFSKFDLWWPLMTSILTWPENDLSKSLRSCRGLSYAVYCLSLRSVVFEVGGGQKPSPARNWTFQSPPGIWVSRNIWNALNVSIEQNCITVPLVSYASILGACLNAQCRSYLCIFLTIMLYHSNVVMS